MEIDGVPHALRLDPPSIEGEMSTLGGSPYCDHLEAALQAAGSRCRYLEGPQSCPSRDDMSGSRVGIEGGQPTATCDQQVKPAKSERSTRIGNGVSSPVVP